MSSNTTLFSKTYKIFTKISNYFTSFFYKTIKTPDIRQEPMVVVTRISKNENTVLNSYEFDEASQPSQSKIKRSISYDEIQNFKKPKF